jgi:hypothetical protein
MWLLGFELQTFGRAVGCSYPLSHLTSPFVTFLLPRHNTTHDQRFLFEKKKKKNKPNTQKNKTKMFNLELQLQRGSVGVDFQNLL